MGADEAVIVADPALDDADQAAVALALARALEKSGPATCCSSARAPPTATRARCGSRVAELLGLPQIGYARKVEAAGGGLRAERSMDDRSRRSRRRCRRPSPW